jgi:hypothetical protein
MERKLEAPRCFEMDSIATLGYIFAAKLAWSLLLFLKDLAGGLGLLGAVDVKKLGSWAVGAHLCRRPPPASPPHRVLVAVS